VRFIVTPLLLLSCYGCCAIIAAYYGYFLPPYYGWSKKILHAVSPWLVSLIAPLCWRKTWQWRRMYDESMALPSLSRGEIYFAPRTTSPGFAERFCKWACLLALVSMPYWSQINGPEWVVAMIVCCWAFFRFCVATLTK